MNILNQELESILVNYLKDQIGTLDNLPNYLETVIFDNLEDFPLRTLTYAISELSPDNHPFKEEYNTQTYLMDYLDAIESNQPLPTIDTIEEDSKIADQIVKDILNLDNI